jgi:hypothetical protein
MTPWLEWLENTWLSATLRDSPNVFLYPTILAFHTLGLAFFVGISSAIALRVLGVASAVPLAPLKTFYPIMWTGFAFNAVSGVLLLLIEPTKFLTMFDFYVKLLAITGAVYCNQALYVRCFRRPAAVDSPRPSPADKRLAVAMLILWGVSITAGRLTAYDDATTQWWTAVGTAGVTGVILIAGYVAIRLYRWIRSTLGGPAAAVQRRGAVSMESAEERLPWSRS